MGGRSSGTPTSGKALVVSKLPTAVQPLGSLRGSSSCHQTRRAPTWSARGLFTDPPGGRGSHRIPPPHRPGCLTKPPPQPCRGLHPPRPGGPGPALPTPQAYSVPRGPAAPGGSTDSDGLACGDVPPHRCPSQSRPRQGGRWGPQGPWAGPKHRPSAQEPLPDNPQRQGCPPTLYPVGSAAPRCCPTPGRGTHPPPTGTSGLPRTQG